MTLPVSDILFIYFGVKPFWANLKLSLIFFYSSLLATEKSPVDPNSSEHIIAINRLQDQLEAMKKQLQSKDQQLMEKDKKVSLSRTFTVLFGFLLIFFVSLRI